MTEQKLKHVVCAVRGGPESRATVTRAIDLALSEKAALTFLHIMDAEFLHHATVGPLNLVYKELVEMGKFTMLILVDRAQRRGVTDVDYIVREGNVRRQLLQAVAEIHADMLVMGRTIRSPGSNVFKIGEIEGFAAELEKQSGMKVILIDPAKTEE